MVTISVYVILTGVVNCAIKSVVIHCAKMVENVETKHAFARRALLGKRATFVCALKTACPTVVALAMANVNVILDTRVKLVPFVTSSMVNVVIKQKNARAILLML